MASSDIVKVKEKKHKPERKKTPTVFQMEVSECGAASLSMILQYYGKYVPLEELRVETGVSRNGCNAKNIYLAAEKYGFTVKASRRDLDTMVNKGHYPSIIHWNFSHFVVFEGFKHNKYYINDPQRGRRKLTRDEMEEGYSETVLEFTPTENFKADGKKRTLLKFAVNRLEGQYITLVAMFLLGIAMILPGILTPVFSQVFIDNILVDQSLSWMKWLLLFMICTLFYQAYFGWIQQNLALLLKTKMSLLSTDRMVSHMFRLPISFFEQRFAGDLVQRVYNNISVSDFLSTQLVQVVINLFTSIIYLLIMLAYSPKLALIGVAFSLFEITLILLTTKPLEEMSIKFGQDTGKLVGSLYNGVTSSASLKAVGAECEYTARVLGHYADVNAMDQRMGRIQKTMEAIPKTVKSVNTVLTLVIGGSIVIKGDMSPGMIMSFSGFLGSFTDPLDKIMSFVSNMQQIKNDMGRVDDIMHYEEEISYNGIKDEHLVGKKLNGEVEFRNVSFAYGKLDKPFIKDFNFHLESGQTVALVGSSGCGKSTIAKMMSSLYRPWSGEILFDGENMTQVPSEVIASSVAVVTQQISLFEGSIFDNISGWKKTIRQEDVIKAAKDACLHDDITKKPGAYEYVLRENGSNISGGQRQRIMIAKALAANPTILIMDEATSALDTITEKEILSNIKKRHCTCVVVAQRLSTIRDCDEIIVIKKGKIFERGTHDELIEKKGLYYKLVAESE